MFAPTRQTDHRTYRQTPTLATALLLAALPLAFMFAVTYPAVALGLAAGAITGAALQR